MSQLSFPLGEVATYAGFLAKRFSEILGAVDLAGCTWDVQCPELRELAALIREERQRLAAHVADLPGREWAALHAGLIDKAIEALYMLAERAADLDGLGDGQPGIAVIATGGYGRRELMPFSDIDVSVVPPPGAVDSSREQQARTDAVIRRFYHVLFDLCHALGLEVGYSYRTIEDLPGVDSTTLTALIEARRLAGNPAVFDSYVSAVRGRMDRVSFLLEKQRERLAHRLDYEPNVWRVEPDLKEGPGGLRDLSFALWMARVCYDLRGADTLVDLTERGLLDGEESQEVSSALDQVLSERVAMHLAAGRKTDVLYISLQDEVAARLGYGDREVEAASADRGGVAGQAAVDRLMLDHYRAASAIHQFADRLVGRCLESELELEGGYLYRNGRIDCGSELLQSLAADPERAVFGFVLGHRYGLRFSRPLSEAIRRAAPRLDPVAPERPSATWLREILTPNAHTPSTLRQMRDLGLLTYLLPEFGQAIGRIPYDPSHEYALCEHSFRLIENLLELETAQETILATLARIYGAMDPAARRVLVCAALLHDAGKVVREADHSLVGAQLAEWAGARLGLDPDEMDQVVRLILTHLDMARISRLREIGDEATIREFGQIVKDTGALDRLYVFTYADTRAVGLGIFGDIEGRLLEELYTHTLAALSEGMAERDLDEVAARIADRAVRELKFRDISEDRVREHCVEMPPQYVISTPLPTMGVHITFVRDLLRTGEPIIDFYTPPDVSYTELTVCTYDDPVPGLFSKIAGALLAHGINTYSARIFTREPRTNAPATTLDAPRPTPHDQSRPIALDTLLIDRGGRPIEPDLQENVQGDLCAVLKNEVRVADLLQRRRKILPQSLDLENLLVRNDLSDRLTVVEIKADDALGLLYVLTRALAQSGLSVHSAKITTWAGKAENVFYVSDPQMAKLPDASLEEVTDRIRAAVGRQTGKGNG